jgi:3-hydroxybutyryl-CoA dehydrogenase
VIQRVAVVGAGTMGAGIAQLCAQAGFSVKVFDSFAKAMTDLPGRLKKSLDASVLKSKLTTAQAERVFHSISGVNALADLAGADLVIEAAAEDLQVKKEIFSELDRVCPDAILATNTSSLSVSSIADGVGTPERVLGIHFFNPPVAMKLVEMVRATKTAPEVFQAAWDFVLLGLKKTPVDVKDTPGFIVNRVMRPYYLVGQDLALEGASITAVDDACRAQGFAPMGPFELMDLIGLDVNLSITRIIYAASGSPERFKPRFPQERLVEAGAIGRKAGKGWYRYEAGAKAGENPDAAKLFPSGGVLTPAEIASRVMGTLAAEARLAFSEGVAGKADIDTAIKLAMNFPKGPFEWQNESTAKRAP